MTLALRFAPFGMDAPFAQFSRGSWPRRYHSM